MNVSEIVRECWGEISASEAPVDMTRSLKDDYGISSLQLVTLMTSVCEASGLALTVLTERDLERIKTPGDIVEVVMSHLGAKDQA